MGSFTNELYSLLISVQEDKVLVPHSCVAEVIRNSVDDSGAGQGDWLRGSVEWRDRQVPIISFEALMGKPVAPAGGRTRIVIINPLDPEDPADGEVYEPYGILAQGFPQMVRVNREMLLLDDSYRVPDGAPVLCQVTLLSARALIPDLEMLQQKVLAAHA